MYATPHALAGFAIIKTFEDNLWIGIPLAIISHFILDFIDEKGLSKKDRLYFDIIPSSLCYLIALLSGQFWIFLLGSICGNLFDLIDKKLYLAIFFPSKFKSTKYFHFQKQLIFPDPKTTKRIGLISGFIIILMLIKIHTFV